MPQNKTSKKWATDEMDEAQLDPANVEYIANRNSPLLARITDMQKKILKHPTFNNPEQAWPLAIGDGGRQEPDALASFKSGMTEDGTFRIKLSPKTIQLYPTSSNSK